MEEGHGQPLCYRFRVSGRVQGVCFRATTREKALQLGLTGWVRNLSGGDVELLAYGDRHSIDEMTAWLWQGPQLAKVIQVDSEILPEGSVGVQNGFEIRRNK